MADNFQQQPLPHHHSSSNILHNFDELPIGNNNKFNISEFADGYRQEQPISAANLTIQQKIQSKVVKIKLEGLEDLKVQLSSGDRLQDFNIQLFKILKQNNPACLQKSLQCAERWIDSDRFWGQKQIREIIENGYINGKGTTKKYAVDLSFKVFTLRPEQLERTIIEYGLKAKTPKIIGGYLSLLNQLLQQFGIKQLKYLKPYLSLTVQVMNNEKLPVVKTEGMNLIKGGLKWVGKDFIWPFISQLKQNMKKQLQNFWQGFDKTQVMKSNRNATALNIPQQKQKSKSSKKKTQQIEKTTGQQSNFDLYQISDPVDIFQKFDERWTQTVLQSQKWNTKTTLLQELASKLNVPKIANTQHRHITQMVRRLLNDSNINVVLAALKVSAMLAKGLRRGFNYSAKILFPYITPKFRDKKTQMVEQTFNTLNNFTYSLTIQQVGEDIKAALKDKTPGMKNNTLKWMLFAIEKLSSFNERATDFLKSSSINSIFENLLNDPSSDVRDSTAKFVMKVRTTLGEDYFKNAEKNINNKDMLQKFNEGDDEQRPTKSKSKDIRDTSTKKNKSQSKSKSIRNQTQQQQVVYKNTYSIKTSSKGTQTFDITEELTKNMKKLNDNNNWQNRKDSAQKLLKLFNYLQRQNPNVNIVSANLYDFLSVLRSRISDPNKQLIKIFVNLVGEVFKFLSEKEAKIQAKSFIQELIQALSDKNELNRKQIYKTFDNIWISIGSDSMIHYIGQILCLESNSNSTSQLGSSPKQYILEYLMCNQNFIKEVESIDSPQNLKHFKDFPKIILSGLCDKNKELRNICQKIFKILNDKVGVQVFKNFVNFKQQKHAFKSDLLTFLQKYDNTEHQFASTSSKLANKESYSNKKSTNEQKTKNSREDSEDFERSHKKVNNNVASLSNSRSKEHSNTSNLTKHITTHKAIVQGSQFFAPIQILTADRILREQMSVKYRSGVAQHPISCQLEIQSSLAKLVNYQQLYLKMFSHDYHKNIQAAQKIIKLCRDVSQTNSIRQIHDLIIKWVVIKLYGGNVSALGVSEVICPVLSILEKKKVPWSDWDLQLIIFFMRQYLIGAYYDCNENIDLIKNIFKLAIALSSGERLLKKILIQFKTDPTSVHKHIGGFRKQGLPFVKYYRRCLVNLCGSFVDYFSNDQFLGEASSIPELKQDKQFVRLLSNKFHESVLKQFSFKLQEDATQPSVQEPKHERSLSQTNNNNSNQSRVSSIDVFVPETKNKSEKNKKVTPQKSLSFIQAGFPPPSPSPVSKNRTLSNYSQIYSNKKIKNLKAFYKNVGFSQQQAHSYFIDLSKYSQPNSHNPLGSNLLKLYPFNQSTIHFFSTLFQPQNQTSQKITTQLSSNCNMIYGSLFNNLMKYMEGNVRQVQAPEKLSSFMHLTQQAIKCPNIFKHVDEGILEKSIRYTIDQLVYEDENRTAIENKLRSRGYNQFKGDIFVKAINGIMLRLLDNSSPLFLINSLLFNIVEVMLQLRNEDQIYQYTNQNINKNKKIGLLIRCFTRVTTTYFSSSLQPKEKQGNQYYNIEEDPNCIKTHHIFKFFILSKQLIQIMQVADLVQFQTREQKVDKNNQPLANTQESVVICLCKIMRGLNRKNLLVRNFQIVKRQKNWGRQEKVISDFILAITGVSISNTNNQPLHNITSNNSQQASESYPTFPQIDEQLKRIIQQLSKTKTFNEGIKNLKIYSQQSGIKFDFKSVFKKMNFENSFIQKVAQEMEKISNMQNSSKSLNPDIQNKLERLKLKLEGISSEQPRNNLKVSSFLEQTEKSIVTIQSGIQTSSLMKNFPQIKTPKNRHGSSIEHVQLQSTQNDLKRRIQQMKSKVNTSTISSSSMNKMR